MDQFHLPGYTVTELNLEVIEPEKFEMSHNDHINYTSACVVIGLCVISFILMLYGGWLFSNGLASSSDVLISIAIPLVAAVVIAFRNFWRNLPCKTK